MTVDVEEYFQVEAFANNVKIDTWEGQQSRIEYQMDLLLDIYAQTNVKATFFTLGWVAERFPGLITKIVAGGHELASHGFMHQHITKQSQQEFRNDIRKAKDTLEQVSGIQVVGYRAPCFSIKADNPWAHDEIADAGYQYSSSSYPIHHDLYGVPFAPTTPYQLDSGLIEIPVTTCTFLGKTLPAGGGGYFRLFPYRLFRFLFNKGLHPDIPANFYTHPWEFDPEQPRLPGGLKSQFRHHVNQKHSASKLEALCRDFTWSTMSECYSGLKLPKYKDWLEAATVMRKPME